MSSIRFQGRKYDCRPGETALQALARGGARVPSSCCNGICQTCLMKANPGAPPVRSQEGLKPTLKEQGYFLPCICRLDNDLELEAALPGEGITLTSQAILIGKEMLNRDIVRLTFECDLPEGSRPGQFINLRRPSDGLTRSYSIAAILFNTFELHVRLLPEGVMSGWIHSTLAIGETCEVAGPLGSCYYTTGQVDQPLLLVGTGSGLAPLWGILNSALSSHHTGPISLYHGAYTQDGLYLVEALNELSVKFPNFNYFPCVEAITGELPFQHPLRVERADAAALTDHANTKGYRAYLCGHPDMVKNAKRKIFLAGASMADIYADPFVLSCQ